MSSDAGVDQIRFLCSKCFTLISASARDAGGSITCPSCQASVPVPNNTVKQPEAPASASVTQPQQSVPAPSAGSVESSVSKVVVESVKLEAPAPAAAPMAAPAEPATAFVAAESMNISSAPGSGVPQAPAAQAAPAAAPVAVATADAPFSLHRSAEAIAQSTPPMGYRATDQEYSAPKKNRTPSLIKAVSAFVFLGVASGIGISVRNGMERTRIENEVQTMIADADAVFAANDVAGAYEKAQSAVRVLHASTQELDAEKKSKWQARIKLIEETKSEMDALNAVFAKAEKDLPGVRSQLENKKTLLGAVTADNKPLHGKVDALLADVARLELKRKQEKLQKELQAADALYAEGKIEDAALKAVEIGTALNEKPVLQDADIEKRVGTLKKRAADLAEAKSERMKARTETYNEVKRKLQTRIDALDEKNADLKPLVLRLSELKKELIAEEKRSRKLKPDEVTELKAVLHELNRRDKNVVAGTVEGDTIGLTVDDKPLRMGFQRTALTRSLFIEVENNRYLVEMDDLFGRESQPGRPGRPGRARRVLTHAMALGEAMKKAGVQSDDLWNAAEEAPLLSARRADDDGKEHIFLGDRLYIGTSNTKTAEEKDVEADFAKKAEALAVAVENDSEGKAEIRRVVSVAVRATYKEADWYDHLPGKFVRQVVAEGYVEKNLPGSATRLKKELQDYRDAYQRINNPFTSFTGNSSLGDEAVEMRTFEDHSIWRLYDKKNDTTSFAIKNPDDEKNCLFILYDFPGKHTAFPAEAQPKTVRMTHQAIGVTATYDLATGKLNFDQETWDKAAALEAPQMPDEIRTSRGYGAPPWALPPHVLLVNLMGECKSIVTPYGRLDIQDFSKIAEPEKRTAAMEKMLDNIAKVLPTANYLHLYFRYFFEYILDSPITSATSLLGSRAHCGDIHQTTYQSMERFMGGCYVGDCDDLAEFFVNVTRRQNKLSYVMALPQHAACGWAEKNEGEGSYSFYVIDTGPPRVFRNKELDSAIEAAFRAYDENKTMRFDPKSLGFLFRFNGEPTRTPYYLSSRMYTDRDYGEVMERVQSYWHFHFYALGIQKMTEMIEKGDKVPENYVELAGLYGQVRETESSIKNTREALKLLGPQDRQSRMSEEFRIALMWREEHENEKAYEAIKPLISELKVLQSDPQSLNFLSMRLQVMGLLMGIDKPFEAWDVISRDMLMIARRGLLKIEHAGGITSIYKKAQEMARAGKVPSAAEKNELNKIETLLKWFYENALFEQEDDFNDYMRKYAFVGEWYAGRYGQKKLVEELLKANPTFPDPATPRKHDDRKDPEAEDWKWIRLSLHAYSLAMGDALDLDEPPEKWRKDEAVKLADAMLKAASEARKFGSLSSSEFQLLSTRVFRAFLIKDWKDLEDVLREVKERDWARLTTDIAETFGRSARFVTPEEFVEQYKVFTKYVKARPAYFTVIYEAYRSEGIEHALQACPVALALWPGDEDMKREAKYLEELARKKVASKAKKAAESKPAGERIVPPPTEPVKVN
ncbi:MAG TPA: hypothetical protein VEK08_14615 [Planctomycetota bacterium]|nr:hypothetical protein [Planctomycetota bacterium]